ncbi:MAG: exosortase/archaeosortase family protein [Verrucomicrobia bacterium]|nr:exosortase/archaeosortase family protein [Verrucomicrobiota bacterium]
MKVSALALVPIAAILAWWIYDLQFQWRNLSEHEFGWIVPVLAGYLVWDRWNSIPQDDSPCAALISFLIVLAATPFVLVAELYKQAIAQTPASSFCLSIGCVLFLAANILHLCGPKTLLHFLFPMMFIFVSVPLPGILWNPIVLTLKEVVTKLDVEFLNLIGIPAFQRVNVIQLPGCALGIDDACSGIRSLQSSVMAALFIGFLNFSSVTSRIAFLLGGMGFAMLGNFLRSLFLAVAVHWRGNEALDEFHDAAGWGILLFTLAGLTLSVRLVRGLDNKPFLNMKGR